MAISRRKGLALVLILALVLFMVCSMTFRSRFAKGVSQERLLSVTPDMTHEQVLGILGAPLSKTMYGAVEAWVYGSPGLLDDGLEIFINFENGRTTNIAVENHDTTVYAFVKGGTPTVQRPECMNGLPR